jgi:hypothetical protein
MRGLDCKHPAHEDMHFTGADDDDLVRQVQQHRDQYHQEMSDEDVQQVVSQNAYDE